MEKAIKSVRISEQTHTRLLNQGNMGESFDTLINRLLDQLESCENAEKRKNSVKEF
jgi:hypothetical protein